METRTDKLSKTLISYVIRNNTNAEIPMSFMGNPYNIKDISNQFTEYKWNVTSINFSLYSILSITYRNSSGSTPYQTTTLTYSDNTLNGVLNTLNSIGIAIFFAENIGGNVYIKTYNDSTEFTILNLEVASFNTTLQYNIKLQTVPSQARVVDETTGTNILGINAPISVSSSLLIRQGDDYRFLGTLSPASLTSALMQVIDVTNSILLFSKVLDPINTTANYLLSPALANTTYLFSVVES